MEKGVDLFVSQQPMQCRCRDEATGTHGYQNPQPAK